MLYLEKRKCEVVSTPGGHSTSIFCLFYGVAYSNAKTDGNKLLGLEGVDI